MTATLETCSTPDRGYMGDRARGASLGRASRTGGTPRARFHLRQVRLDSGGYDPGGAYWGHGGTLFEAFTADGAEFMTLRVWPDDRRAAFERRGGLEALEQCRAARPAKAPKRPYRMLWNWAAIGTRETAKDLVRADYPDARFFC